MDIPVYFTSDLTSSERRVSPRWTIGYLKQRLEQITGIECQYMALHHYPNGNSNEYKMIGDKDDSTLAEYNIAPYSRIHVMDLDPNSKLKQLSQVSATQEFQLSEEEYNKRADSVLQWKKQQQLGRFDPAYNDSKKRAQEENEQKAQNIQVGQRCRVINIEGERRGVVKFVGRIPELDKGESVWTGVEFDEPVGKNNGTIGTLRIFDAKPNHGSFVRPKQVEVGDFPELDPFASDEEEL